jgi:hypothetical protein
MADDADTPGMGDNKGPPLSEVDPTKLVDVKILVPLLHQNYGELEKRRDELNKGIVKWTAAHAVKDEKRPVVATEQDCGDTLDFLNELRDFINKEVEPARKKVKEPLDKAAKAIQAWFAIGLQQPILNNKQPIEDAYSLYLVRKQDRERARRKQEAYDAQQEAMRLAHQAQRAKQPEQQQALMERAFEVEYEAEKLAAKAEAPVAEVTRVRGDLGSVGGLKEDWVWEVENLIDLVQAVAQGQQPIEMLTTNDVFINGLVRPKDGRRKIPGLNIHAVMKGR